MPNSGIVFYRAMTPVHPGSGDSVGTIDNAIQREVHTGWPTCGTKGAHRSLFRSYLVKESYANSLKDADSHNETLDIFGAASGDGDNSDGALAFSDARIFAFPVRSSRGLFALVTCPSVINNFTTIACRIAGVQPPFERDTKCNNIDDDSVRVLGCLENYQQKYYENVNIFLEELMLVPKSPEKTDKDLLDWLKKYSIFDTERLGRLMIVSDDVFKYFTNQCTTVIDRIRLESEIKKVVTGALFREEYLPTESLLYSFVVGKFGRNQESIKSSYDNWKNAVKSFGYLMNLGGDESTGKGWCQIHILDGEEIKNEDINSSSSL